MSDWAATLRSGDLLNSSAQAADAQPIMVAMIELHGAKKDLSAASILEILAKNGASEDRMKQVSNYLQGEPENTDGAALTKATIARSKSISGRLTRWAGYTSMMLNVGAFFGIYGFTLITHRIGRRKSFAISFLAAGSSTAMVFWFLNDVSDVFWMMPLMGFCLLSLFGGYAIYFPELFPTRLRSTGTSFCYNVGRFIAASGPLTLGLLTSEVFVNYPEPMRYAGVSMCSVFLLGLLALPFAPETRGEPLPQ